jgi:hypothetical protein
MSVQVDQLLYKYLSDIGDLAQGVLSQSRRSQLVSSLRSRIEQERDRQGITSAAAMRALLDNQFGPPAMVVAAESHRDPEYQQRLTERLTAPVESFTATTDTRLDPTVPTDGTPRPQIPLDADPFAGLAAIGGEVATAMSAEPALATGDATTTATLPPVRDVFQTVPGGGMVSSQESPWRQQPPTQLAGRLIRSRPREAIAMGLLVVGLVFGSWLPLGPWIPLIVGYLVALTSYVFTPSEKRFALIGVPIGTLVIVSFGFWLHDTGAWGGTRVSHADVVGQGGTFLGTVPRIISVVALLYFGWRLARRITRDGL